MLPVQLDVALRHPFLHIPASLPLLSSQPHLVLTVCVGLVLQTCLTSTFHLPAIVCLPVGRNHSKSVQAFSIT